MTPEPSFEKRTIQEAVWYCSHARKIDNQSLVEGLALDGDRKTSEDLKWLKQEANDIYCSKNQEGVKFKGRVGGQKLEELGYELYNRARRTRGLHHIQDIPEEWLKWAFQGLIRATAQNLRKSAINAALEESRKGSTPWQDRKEPTPQTDQSPSSVGTLSHDDLSAPYSGRDDANTPSVASEVPPRSAKAAGTKNKTGFHSGFSKFRVAQTPIAQIAGSTGRTTQEAELRGSSTLGDFLTLLALVNDFAESAVITAQEVDLRRSRTLEFLSKVSTLVDDFAEFTGKSPQQVWHLLCKFKPTGEIGDLRSESASHEAMEQHIDIQPSENSSDEAAAPDLEVKREPEPSLIQDPSAARKRKANSIDEHEDAEQSDDNTSDAEKHLVERLRDESRPPSRASPHQRSDTAGDEVTISGARKRSKKSEKKGKDDNDDVVVLRGRRGLPDKHMSHSVEKKERRPLASTEDSKADVEALSATGSAVAPPLHGTKPS